MSMNLAYSCLDSPPTKCYPYTALLLFLPRAPGALAYCFEHIYFPGVFGNLGMVCINRENIQGSEKIRMLPQTWIFIFYTGRHP